MLLRQIIVERESKDVALGQTFLYIRDGVVVDGSALQRERTHRADGVGEESPTEFCDSPMAAAYVVMAEIVDRYA